MSARAAQAGGAMSEDEYTPDMCGDRFWGLDPDPQVPEHPQNLGPGWIGVVDERAGGVVAWCHRDNYDAIVRGLHATYPA